MLALRESELTPMPGKSISRYRIVEKLDKGHGCRYKVEDTRLGHFVELKFLPEVGTRPAGPQALQA